MGGLRSIKLILFFAVLTVALTWLVIFAYEGYMRRPFYQWVETRYPGAPKHQDEIEQRVEHFFISTTVDIIVVTLLLRLIGRQQRRLSDSEERHRALFEHANDGIGVVMEASHELVDVNARFGEILGGEPQDLIGKHFCELVSESRQLPAARFCKGGNDPNRNWLFTLAQSGEGEIDLHRETGAVTVSVSCSLFSTGRERLFMLIVRDLTERKRLEREREQIERQLFQTSKLASIGELSAGVAHEINNPLNCIINFAELLNGDGAATTDRDRQFIEGIIEEGDRIGRIVRDLLTFAGQDKPKPAGVPLAPVISNSLSLFAHQLMKNGIAVEVEVPDDLPNLLSDDSRLRQVVVNMISNAQHALNAATREHRLFRITARDIDIGARRMVCVEFYDNGIGIPGRAIDKVFDPFFTTRRETGGTGLGLSVSFGIVRDWGGTITVQSTEGEFTRFTVHIPAAASNESNHAKSVVSR